MAALKGMAQGAAVISPTSPRLRRRFFIALFETHTAMRQTTLLALGLAAVALALDNGLGRTPQMGWNSVRAVFLASSR